MQLHVTSGTLKGQCQGHSDFGSSCKGAELRNLLLLKTNSKSHKGNPVVPHLTMSDLERLKQRSPQISKHYIS